MPGHGPESGLDGPAGQPAAVAKLVDEPGAGGIGPAAAFWLTGDARLTGTTAVAGVPGLTEDTGLTRDAGVTATARRARTARRAAATGHARTPPVTGASGSARPAAVAA